MPADPVHVDSIPIRVSAVKDLDVIAGLDRGCSLTKIAFLPKNTSLDDADFVFLQCLTFLNKNFDDALHTMRDQAQLPASGKLHCTGIGGDVYKEIIKRIVGLDIEIAPEILTLGPGTYLTLINSKPKDIFHPIVPFKDWSDDPKEPIPNTAEEESLFPAYIMYIGSGAGFLRMEKDGKFDICGSGFLGKTFMSLANLLVGTTDYNELTTLAASGDRYNVCQKVIELMENRQLSTAGPVPFDKLAFPFGKASNESFDRSKVSRADMAASLIAYYATGIYTEMAMLFKTTGVNRYYIAGNFTRAEVVRSQILEANTRMPPRLDIRFIATGHTGAIGAMLLKTNDPRWAGPPPMSR